MTIGRFSSSNADFFGPWYNFHIQELHYSGFPFCCQDDEGDLDIFLGSIQFQCCFAFKSSAYMKYMFQYNSCFILHIHTGKNVTSNTL